MRIRALALIAMAFIACGVPTNPEPPPSPTVACPLLGPKELVSGAAPGIVRQVADGRFAWGVGADQLTQAAGEFAVGPPDLLGVPPGHPHRVQVRGREAVVILVGDEGVGEVAITWSDGACPYTIWLARGTSLEQAREYAARF